MSQTKRTREEKEALIKAGVPRHYFWPGEPLSDPAPWWLSLLVVLIIIGLIVGGFLHRPDAP